MTRLGLRLVQGSGSGASPLPPRCSTVVATHLALVAQPTDRPRGELIELLPLRRLGQRRLNRHPDPRPEGTAA